MKEERNHADRIQGDCIPKRQSKLSALRFVVLISLTVTVLLIGHSSRSSSSELFHVGLPLVWPWGVVHTTIPSRRHGSTTSQHQIANFKWSSISAAPDLQFTPCYTGLLCAKLELPLDYFNNTYPSATISLALVKVPARVSMNDPRYGGPVLINPGGPGGSGTSTARALGIYLQTIIDSPEDPSILKTWEQQNASSAKYFDIIGFDPRGVGETEPRAVCMPDVSSAWSWALREETEGVFGSSDAALGRLWSMTKAYTSSCLQTMGAKEGPDVKQYLTTASVARDMLELVERHAKFAHKVVSDTVTRGTSNRFATYVPPTFIPNKSKLQYWGFSYGTFLGSTYAAMFPSRVGRLVLDGVVDSDEYLANLGYKSLHDSEKVMNSFYIYCASAGPAACPLAHSPDGSSPSTIEARVKGVLESLYHNPLPVSSPLFGPELITYSDIKRLLFLALYFPETSFPALGLVLNDIANGNGSILAEAMRANHIYTCPLPGQNTSAALLSETVATTAILCSDGSNHLDVDITAFEKHLNLLTELSPTAGPLWAILPLRCAHWGIQAQYRFTGPFEGVKTSNPILWISNTADPVTPLVSARKMRKKFPGSGLVVAEATGHCSLASAITAPCTFRSVRAYFQTGEVVPEGEVKCPRVQDGEAGDSHDIDVEMMSMAARAARKFFYENVKFFGLSGRTEIGGRFSY